MIRGWWPVPLRTTKYCTGLLHTTKYYSSTTPHYKGLLQYYVLHVGAGNRAQDLPLPRLTPYPRAELSCRYKTQMFTRPGQCAEQFQELKICVSPQFRAIGPPNPTRGFMRQNQNVRFATAACRPNFKMYVSLQRRSQKCMKRAHGVGGRPRFTTVSDARPARSDERVARPREKFAFHHSFGRPTSTK